MTYFSTDIGAQIHDINDGYYLYQDKSLHSALVIEKRAELATLDVESETLESEWERTFHTTHYVLKLKERALKGLLRESSFRSVAWQVFLEVLPGDIRQWVTVAGEKRMRYTELKSHYVIDPHETEDMSLTVNNPLSQEEQSPWAQFFQDNELRKVIMQDIKRTYPGELMFEQIEIRDIMLNILFIYAREQPEIDYKQGMHELLAPIVYVFYNEYMLVKDVTHPSSQLIRTVAAMEYLEHDLYWCYVALMKHTHPYYTTDKVNKPEPVNKDQTLLFKEAAPQPSSYIVQSLEELQNGTLKRFDPELQQHLQKLAIQPQLYGLRWMRLLFGREFPLKDMLVIWDALLASPDFAGMVEYICVAMLLYIRDALLCNDHTGCLTLLMRYPETHDVQLFVQRALFLRNPSHYDCPPNLQYRPNSKPRVTNGTEKTLVNFQKSGMARQIRADSATFSAPKSPVTAISDSIKRKMSAPKVHTSVSVSSLSRTEGGASGNGSSELAEYKRVHEYCSNRLDSLLDDLQNTICDLCEEETDHEDKLMVSLAGLKQVRDVLKGNVSLGCTLAPASTDSITTQSSENGDNEFTDSQVEREETEDREDSSSHDTTSVSSSVPPPPLPPTDLETLVLFNDFSLSSKTLKKPQNQPKKTTSEPSTKNQDFFDPLSSALANDSSEEFPDFLRRK
ncbi:hypothetical protein ACHWQZ_G009689 [Mnemiopsis leidyi]